MLDRAVNTVGSRISLSQGSQAGSVEVGSDSDVTVGLVRLLVVGRQSSVHREAGQN
ncbi:MAG: hypothetical protein Fues2KO_53850 [Fuerstiella sp.]